MAPPSPVVLVDWLELLADVRPHTFAGPRSDGMDGLSVKRRC